MEGGIQFESDISAYKDYKPNKTPEGYMFEGRYLDDACSEPYSFDGKKMPDNDIKVYAKWRQIQYRVFLHPDVPNSDELSEEEKNNLWGSSSQGMNFRVSY